MTAKYVDFKERYIQKQIMNGYEGIVRLLEDQKNEEIYDYDLLCKVAGVNELRNEIEIKRYHEFVFDSLRMQAEDFMDKWTVNFWIARSANLKALSIIYHEGKVSKEHLINTILEELGDVI